MIVLWNIEEVSRCFLHVVIIKKILLPIPLLSFLFIRHLTTLKIFTCLLMNLLIHSQLGYESKFTPRISFCFYDNIVISRVTITQLKVSNFHL